MLIAALVDDNGGSPNGVPDSGDMVVTDRYPTTPAEPGSSEFADFTVTAHPVLSAGSPQPGVCAVRISTSEGDKNLNWVAGTDPYSDSGDNLEVYYEFGDSSGDPQSILTDWIQGSRQDNVLVDVDSPSRPSTAVTGSGNDVFLDVQLNCGDGAE